LGIEILFDWLLRRIAFLNLDNESNFLIAMSSVFHSLTVDGINDELVIESLQKGTIKLWPFRKWYIVVLWIVGGTRWCKYSAEEWNTLDIAIRKFDSLSKFKNAIRLNSQSNKISIPKPYYYGPRKRNVILTQLRCTASFLNHDLYKVHIFFCPACSCGAPKKMRTTSFLFAPNILK
jgi:hypothetical protein